jgi:hypothetical protein
VLDETAKRNLLSAIDVAISRAIDAYNIAWEAADTEIANMARGRVTDLQELRDAVRARPTRPARWQFARSPRGDARSR